MCVYKEKLFKKKSKRQKKIRKFVEICQADNSKKAIKSSQIKFQITS